MSGIAYPVCCCDVAAVEDYYGNPCDSCTVDNPPDCWEVAIAGLGNGNCTDCSYYNATWILKRIGYVIQGNCTSPLCCWETVEEQWDCGALEVGDSTPNALRLTLETNAFGFRIWVLTIGILDVPLQGNITFGYRLSEDTSAGDFNPSCNREIELTTKTGDSTACSTYPSSLTLVPANC